MNTTVTVLRPYVLQIDRGDHLRNMPFFTAKAARHEAKRLSGAPGVISITLIDHTSVHERDNRIILWEA